MHHILIPFSTLKKQYFLAPKKDIDLLASSDLLLLEQALIRADQSFVIVDRINASLSEDFRTFLDAQRSANLINSVQHKRFC